MALGQNHIIIQSNNGQVFGMGSNQFGQLGLQNNQAENFYEHPLNMSRLYFTNSPIQIQFFNSNPYQMNSHSGGANEAILGYEFSEKSPVV